MSTPVGSNYKIELYIGNSSRDWGPSIKTMQWKSFVNGGFIFRAKLMDFGFDLLSDLFTTDYFRKARQNQRDGNGPVIVQFRLGWKENEYKTPWRTGLISDLSPKDTRSYGGLFEFIAIDPVSYYINNGDCSGTVYKGKIGGDNGIISQVVQQYVPSTIAGMNFIPIITDTTDSPSKYWMMRQDPKTFISSLLDWSSAFTPHRTSWIVATGEDDGSTSDGDGSIYLSIEESYVANLGVPSAVGDQDGPLLIRFGGRAQQIASDVIDWEMLHDSFMVTLNTQLVTSGISAVSGQYLDRVSDSSKQSVFVNDSNTESKVNPTFGPDRGYSKPKVIDRGWTDIRSIPEFNAGDPGKKYNDYIDGRARQVYMDMLNMVMRIKVTIPGEPRLADCLDLGRTYVSLKWLGVEDNKAKFMDGNWLLYGWHHRVNKSWETDVYLSRLDFDATAIPGNK